MNIIKKLKEMAKNESTSELKKYVIEDILNSHGTPEYIESYLKDVVYNGGVSGTISSLIYYEDTKKFYFKFESEIMDLLEEKDIEIVMENLPLSNNLAWVGYEAVAQELLNTLNIEY